MVIFWMWVNKVNKVTLFSTNFGHNKDFLETQPSAQFLGECQS